MKNRRRQYDHSQKHGADLDEIDQDRRSQARPQRVQQYACGDNQDACRKIQRREHGDQHAASDIIGDETENAADNVGAGEDQLTGRAMTRVQYFRQAMCVWSQ